MSKKIYGRPVATPINPNALVPNDVVKTVNGIGPDENGNVVVEGGNVDLTGYATEEWVREGYQPKGEYLTEHQDISGKLDASALPTAINTALAQAKASGEFKGEPGQPGEPGKDYTLTAADKQEIAELTAPLVDVPQGGGGAEWELVFDKTFTEADLGTASWEVSTSSPAEEIVVIASNLLSKKDMGFNICVNGTGITTNIPYLTAAGTSNKQVYCALKGDVWKVDISEYGYDALGKGGSYGGHPNPSNYTVVGKLPAVGKATKIKFNQSVAQDWQVYGGSVRIYAR